MLSQYIHNFNFKKQQHKNEQDINDNDVSQQQDKDGSSYAEKDNAYSEEEEEGDLGYSEEEFSYSEEEDNQDVEEEDYSDVEEGDCYSNEDSNLIDREDQEINSPFQEERIYENVDQSGDRALENCIHKSKINSIGFNQEFEFKSYHFSIKSRNIFRIENDPNKSQQKSKKDNQMISESDNTYSQKRKKSYAIAFMNIKAAKYLKKLQQKSIKQQSRE